MSELASESMNTVRDADAGGGRGRARIEQSAKQHAGARLGTELA